MQFTIYNSLTCRHYKCLLIHMRCKLWLKKFYIHILCTGKPRAVICIIKLTFQSLEVPFKVMFQSTCPKSGWPKNNHKRYILGIPYLENVYCIYTHFKVYSELSLPSSRFTQLVYYFMIWLRRNQHSLTAYHAVFQCKSWEQFSTFQFKPRLWTVYICGHQRFMKDDLNVGVSFNLFLDLHRLSKLVWSTARPH